MLAPSAQWRALPDFIHPDPERAAAIAEHLRAEQHRFDTDPSIRSRYITAHIAATHDRIRAAAAPSS